MAIDEEFTALAKDLWTHWDQVKHAVAVQYLRAAFAAVGTFCRTLRRQKNKAAKEDNVWETMFGWLLSGSQINNSPEKAATDYGHLQKNGEGRANSRNSNNGEENYAAFGREYAPIWLFHQCCPRGNYTF